MKPVRPFISDDIPQVADLFQRVLLKEMPSQRKLPRQALPDYFAELFFQNPWRNEEMPSLVYAEPDGGITGFLGVVPRPMTFQGRSLRVANSMHFMVEPDRRSSLAGIHLLKAFFSGVQDLSFTDGAGEAGRKVWEGLGGKTAQLYSLRWTRVFRPAAYALHLLRQKSAIPAVCRLLMPGARLLDATTAHLLPRYFPQAGLLPDGETLTAEEMLRTLPQFIRQRLQPDYDAPSLWWLLEKAAQMKAFGDLQCVLVRQPSRNIIGWYLYFRNPGGMGEVVQVVAANGAEGVVYEHLFHQAWQYGLLGLTGTIEPRMLAVLSEKQCAIQYSGPLTLIHSRDEELLQTIFRGEAFFSRLDGDWCLRF